MKYESLKKLVIVILLIFAIAGLLVNFLPGKEAYPFYSWNLFSKVPNNETRYYLRVTEYRGEKKRDFLVGGNIEDYLEVENLGEFFWLVQEFGQAVKRGEGEDIKMKIDSMFKAAPLSYQLVLIEYDPYQFKRYEKVFNEEIIDNFRIEEKDGS